MKMVVGVDEAGRGPLAGPVAVGVAMVPGNFAWQAKLPGVNDSKQLSEKKREEIFELARKLKASGQLDYAVTLVSAKIIDEKGIVLAIKLAQERCLKKLGSPVDAHIKLDGGLVAPEKYNSQETIIKGDAKEPVIGLASIMAKVTRDRYMMSLAKDPACEPYDFSTHKGYGTKKHREAIAKYGLNKEHRASFCKNIVPGSGT